MTHAKRHRLGSQERLAVLRPGSLKIKAMFHDEGSEQDLIAGARPAWGIFGFVFARFVN